MRPNNKVWTATGFLIAAAMVSAAQGGAALAGGLYDMDALLNQPHPFAGTQVVPAAPSLPDRSVAPPARISAPPQARPQAMAQAPSRASSPGGGISAILSEVRLGLLVHDEGPFSRNKEDGFDGNIEILFNSPALLDLVWSPRPHLGFSINSAGDTNQYYMGLTWDWDLWRGVFTEFSLAGAVHDGETTQAPEGRKELGCRVLFRGSLSLGYRFAGRHSLSLFMDHSSNFDLCDTNESLENFGLRYGYMF